MKSWKGSSQESGLIGFSAMGYSCSHSPTYDCKKARSCSACLFRLPSLSVLAPIDVDSLLQMLFEEIAYLLPMNHLP